MTAAELLRHEGIAEKFLDHIVQIREVELKEVITNEKIEHVKSVKAIDRILAKLRELEKSVLTHETE
jgi:Mn-dependent DtxR family transcriptional regulator